MSGDNLKRSIYFPHWPGKKSVFFLWVAGNVLYYIDFILGQGKQSATTQRELKFLNSYLSIHRDNRIQIGHQLGDFIKSCTFGGLECTVDNR